MQKRLLIATLLVASSLVSVGCSKTKAPKDSIINPNGDKLYVQQVDKQFYLNLTDIGLYNGQKGTLLQNSNVEYGVALSNLNVGDALPTSEITSRTHNVSFLTWCYYGGDGMLTYTTSVVADVNLYHAVFEYKGSYDGNYHYDDQQTTSVVTSQDTPSQNPTSQAVSQNPTSQDVNTDIQRYYFIDASWWNEAAAASNILLYKNEQPSGLGVKMSYVAWDATKKVNTWYMDVDLSQYSYAVVIRVNGEGTQDWGARTSPIELSKEFNTITLSEEVAWKGEGNFAKFTTSMVIY